MQTFHAESETAPELQPTNTSTITTGKNVTLRPGKRGRYTQAVSLTELEEGIEEGIEEVLDGAQDFGEYDGAGLLDTDIGASSLEDTPNPESVREEVEAEAESVKKMVRDTILR